MKHSRYDPQSSPDNIDYHTLQPLGTPRGHCPFPRAVDDIVGFVRRPATAANATWFSRIPDKSQQNRSLKRLPRFRLTAEHGNVVCTIDCALLRVLVLSSFVYMVRFIQLVHCEVSTSACDGRGSTDRRLGRLQLATTLAAAHDQRAGVYRQRMFFLDGALASGLPAVQLQLAIGWPQLLASYVA